MNSIFCWGNRVFSVRYRGAHWLHLLVPPLDLSGPLVTGWGLKMDPRPGHIEDHCSAGKVHRRKSRSAEHQQSHFVSLSMHAEKTLGKVNFQLSHPSTLLVFSLSCVRCLIAGGHLLSHKNILSDQRLIVLQIILLPDTLNP